MSNAESAGPGDLRVKDALRDYFERRDRGESVDRQRFLAEHREIADELRSLLDADGDLAGLRNDAPVPSGGGASAAAAPSAEVSTHSVSGRAEETLPPKETAAGATSGALPERFGRYHVIRALGSGAMGTVYLAEDTKLHRQVALKTSSFEHDATGELLERFYREAHAAAQLRSANICQVFDVDQIEGRHIISMAYIEGQPLSSHIRPEKPYGERPALLIVRKLALALQEAHDHGVIHRDLKPGNVMIDTKGEPIITDFGLASTNRPGGEARLTQSGMIIGSPAYMSPEQVEADPDRLTCATDQYSLGVILYEMLTGQVPFRGTVTAIIAAILTRDPPPPSELRPGLNPQVEALCLKMMAKSPTARFPSLKAAAAEMATLIKSLPAAGSGPVKTVSPKGAAQSASSPASSSPPLAAKRTPVDSAANPQAGSAADSTTETNQAALAAAARKCLGRHDYEQVIQMLEQIPEGRRTDEIAALLSKARGLADEVQFLLTEIDEAIQKHDGATAVRKAQDLKRLKPKHAKLREVEEKCGYGDGKRLRPPGARLFGGRVGEGSWVPWGVIAFGAAVFGLMLWAVTVYLRVGEAVVKVTINDPEVKVGFQGRTLTVENARDKVKVDPGENTLKIRYGDLEFQTTKFTLKKGENPAVEVSLLDDKLAAKFGEQELGAWSVPRPKATPPAPAESGWIDLLAQVTPDDGNSRGTWTRTTEGHLHGDRTETWPFPQLSFAAHPAGSYELEFTVRFENTDHVILHVPAGAGMANLILIRRLGAVIWQKGGPFAPGMQPAEQKINYALEPDKEYAVHVSVDVAPDGSHVKLTGTIDGQALPALEDDPKQLASVEPPPFVKMTPLPSIRKELSVHIGMGNTATIMRFRYRTLGGPARTGIQSPPASVVLTSPDWEWTEPENLGDGVNTSERELSPSLTADEKILFFTRAGKIHMSRRKSIDEPFPEAVPLAIGDGSDKDAHVSVSGDGLVLVFSSTPGKRKDQDVFLCVRKSLDEPFGPPTRLPAPVNTTAIERVPQISSDALSLVVSSNRPGGHGLGDLYRFTRKSREEPFGNEENLGPVVNTPLIDAGGWMSPDGLVLIRTTNVRAGDDRESATVLCTRRKASDPFEETRTFGPVFEKHAPRHAVASLDGRRLYFHSQRPGGKGEFDLWMSRRVPKGAAAAGSPPADAFQTGSVWADESAGLTLTVVERGNGTFRARFVVRDIVVREINGTVTGDRVSWLAKDVRNIKGNAGGDNVGTIVADRIDFTWRGPGTRSGNFTLRLQKPASGGASEKPLLPSALLASEDFEWSEPENLGPGVNSPAREWSPSITADERILVFARPDGIHLSRRKSTDEPFGEAEKLPEPINEPDSKDNFVCISGDGLLLAFASTRAPSEKVDIWVSHRKMLDEPFGAVLRLGPPVNTEFIDTAPRLSFDGLRLIISSTRDKTGNQVNLYEFTRGTRGAPFGNEQDLGDVVNTPRWNASGGLSSDGLAMYRLSHARRQPGPADDEEGQIDLCLRSSLSEPFTKAIPLRGPFDGMKMGVPVPSFDGQRIYFRARRKDAALPDLWVSHRVPKKDAAGAEVDAPKEFTTTASGLKYRILRKSNGRRPAATDSIKVHYRGWHDDGTEFDSSYKRLEPTVFSLDRVIRGWSEGMQLVGVGGMIEIEVPPSLGYGAVAKTGIPPNSTLHFRIELIDIVSRNSSEVGNLSASAILASTDWEWSRPESLGPGVNTSSREMGPSLTADEKTLLFNRDQTLFLSRRGSIDEPFGEAVRLPDSINDPGKFGRIMGSISGDGLLLAYSVRHAQDAMPAVWMCQRNSVDEPFGKPERLPAPVNGDFNAAWPRLSPDGLRLLVTSARHGRERGPEIFEFSRRSRGQPFENEVRLSDVVNTTKFNLPAFLSSDGLALLRATRARVNPDDDEPVTQELCLRPSVDAPFASAVPFDPPPEADHPAPTAVSLDGRRLYFAARVSGDSDLFVSHRVRKK